MKATKTPSWVRSRQSPQWLRWPWQQPINLLPEGHTFTRAVREQPNVHTGVPLTSDRAAHTTKAHQRVQDDRLASIMQAQFRPRLPKANHLNPETLALTRHYLAIAPRREPLNSREGIHELMREHPEVDEKSAAFNIAIRPNKPQRSPGDLDPDRLGFARWLVEHGTFNEGFEGEVPPQYRSAFSDDDLKRHDE